MTGGGVGQSERERELPSQQTNKQTDMQRGREADRQTDRQICVESIKTLEFVRNLSLFGHFVRLQSDYRRH